ncbi:AMSH-like ubiquitin thioesterase 1 [Phalaenopsis equestris]|uniref:AMSH-like ubiquitin thioesterase 1 n=1 Tax=Phalaenopsis equestris TaxID=78828 RepID=UPI0009E309E8|nr:AMSH-like ubiquitin thioesterase 1 [Phalaenopsis equestris]
MKSPRVISIAASAPRLDVDNRISLRNYYRIANNLIKQADIYREEKNIIDLYVMLLRFSSLITETIPYHRDYHASLQGEKLIFKKKLLHVMSELEALKPEVQQCIEELNRKSRSQVNRWDQNHQNTYVNNSLEWPSVKKQTLKSDSRLVYRATGQNGVSRFPSSQQAVLPQSKHMGDQIHKLSLTTLRPKEETLSRHSILGPNGLSGHWLPPSFSQPVQYPCNIDLSPIEIPSLPQSKQDDPAVKENGTPSQDNTILAEVLSLHDGGASFHAEQPSSLISFDDTEVPTKIDLIRNPSPPPVRAEVEDLVAMTSQLSNSLDQTSLSTNELVGSESPLEVHISVSMMESFLRVAKSNTDRHIETCGVIAGLLKNKKFFVTALIIPKQEGSTDSCQATNEEEIFDYQDKNSLFPLGWIHTHPTQSCFMSAIDVHTHYSYQVMLPEAIAIVMAPCDSSRKHGIFRLTTPGGMSIIRKCDQRGFHPHQSPPDGGPIYDHCADVYMDPSLKFDVVDLR